MTLRRAGPATAVAVALVAVLGAVALGDTDSRTGAARAGAAVPGTPPMPMELEVLVRWDRQRAAAYSRGDLPGLLALYHAGSRTGRADELLLAAWTRRGLRVHGLRMQLLAYDVGERSAHRFELTVTDRMHHAVALGPRPCGPCPPVRVELPAGQPETRTITFLRRGAGWVVDEVRPLAALP